MIHTHANTTQPLYQPPRISEEMGHGGNVEGETATLHMYVTF